MAELGSKPQKLGSRPLALNQYSTLTLHCFLMFCPHAEDERFIAPCRHADYKQSGCVEKLDVSGVDYAWEFESSFVTSDNLPPCGVLMVLKVRVSSQQVQSVLSVEIFFVTCLCVVIYSLRSNLFSVRHCLTSEANVHCVWGYGHC